MSDMDGVIWMVWYEYNHVPTLYIIIYAHISCNSAYMHILIMVVGSWDM